MRETRKPERRISLNEPAARNTRRAATGACPQTGRLSAGRRAGSLRQTGFTLLEIMVVVLLIALSATFLVINLDRDRDGIAELEARRFARLVEQARDESILSGSPLAVQVNPDTRSYSFLRHDKEWSRVENDDIFRRRELPEDVGLSFESANDRESGGLLVIEGLGEVTPFVFTVRGESRLYKVSIDDAQNFIVTSEPSDTT